MKKMTHLLVAAAFVVPAFAQATSAPPPPDIAGKAYYLLDYQSGQTIAARDADVRIAPASLTKLMTAYVTFRAIREHRLSLDQNVTVTTQGWKTGGSRMFLDPRTPVKVSDLIRGMLVQSGNDAAVTLSEVVGGSPENFAVMMTAQARELGMSNSQFKDPTGLPNPDHYTTVHDLAILTDAVIHDFPEFFPIFSMKSFTYNKITQPNRNLLLFRDPNVDGMKTGFTDAAGYNMITTSHRDGRRVISVVVGTASEEARAAESAKLLGYGLQFYETPKLYPANRSVGQDRVDGGVADSVPVGFVRDIYVTVPKGEATRVQSSMALKTATAPVHAGQVVGTLTMSLDGKVLGQQPVVALQSVDEGGFFSRLWGSIKRFLHL